MFESEHFLPNELKKKKKKKNEAWLIFMHSQLDFAYRFWSSTNFGQIQKHPYRIGSSQWSAGCNLFSALQKNAKRKKNGPILREMSFAQLNGYETDKQQHLSWNVEYA